MDTLFILRGRAGGSSIPGERVRRQRGGVTREISRNAIGGGSVVKRDGIHGGQSMPLIPGGVDLVPGPERYDLPPPSKVRKNTKLPEPQKT